MDKSRPTPLTLALANAFIGPVLKLVTWHSELDCKPLDLDLDAPLPSRLRVYLYSLVGGAGTKRPHEYKANLRVPGQKEGEYGSFAQLSGRYVIVSAYRPDLDVFVLWDAALHHRFKWAGNIQVHSDTVHTAAALGWAEQSRKLASGSTELVIACQSATLPDALVRRLGETGGV